MAQPLVDKDGKPVEVNKEVTANLNEPDGIKLSPLGMAMIDVMITAQMLNMYGAQNILNEAPDSLEEIQRVVNEEMDKLGEFTVEHVKQHVMMAFQIACTHLAEVHARQVINEGIEETRRRLKDGDFNQEENFHCEPDQPETPESETESKTDD